MRFAWLSFTLWGCGPPPPATDPAPTNPGVTAMESGQWSTSPQGTTVVFVETSTDSGFNLAGQALDGALYDDQVWLGQLPAMTAFWFAWSTHFPGARVWDVGINNEGEAILANDQCGVPCDQMISACFGGKDCIPSVDDPQWTDSDDLDQIGYLSPDDRVLGLMSPLGARAYPLDALWRHEIVNDTFVGWTFSVTYCPLTGSGILVEGEQSGDNLRFGVSGRLFNSNLIFYDRTTQSLYGQMRQVGFQGDHLGLALRNHAMMNTTWSTWVELFPDTEVLSDQVGVSTYSYGEYRTDDSDIFMTNHPSPDPLYPNKSMAIGVTVNEETVIYPLEELARLGEAGVVEDEIGGLPVLVVFDGYTDTAMIYSRRVGGHELHFERF